jgi:hypothetical protein
MNSGYRTNSAPRAAASSAYLVACLRFPSISWSSDFICTIAIRKVLASDFGIFPRSRFCPLNGISTATVPPTNESAISHSNTLMRTPRSRETRGRAIGERSLLRCGGQQRRRSMSLTRTLYRNGLLGNNSSLVAKGLPTNASGFGRHYAVTEYLSPRSRLCKTSQKPTSGPRRRLRRMHGERYSLDAEHQGQQETRSKE